MRNLLVFGLATILATATAVGQGLNVAESAKRPGDPLRYTITLDRPVKGEVNIVYVGFGLTSAIREDQRGLPTSFQTSKFRAVSPTEYQVDDSVPTAMSGTYLLGYVQFRTKDGAIGQYDYPKDFKQENTIKVETGDKDIFPNIKSVAPSR